MKRPARRVLLIGWDGADWELITPLLEAGLLPCLDRLIDGGVMGNLTALNPLVSPLLWTSIATGRRADGHRILGDIEADPATGGARPVASTTRKVKAVWNILSQAGLRTHAVNWWASHPAEPIRGVCVSNQYPKANAPPGFPWPLPPGSLYPERLGEVLSALRVHPGALVGEPLLPFVPEAARVDPSRDHRLAELAVILAEAVSAHAAATWVMEHEPWDFLAVYDDALDRISHRFMCFHPPRLDQVSESDFALYKDVVTGMYRFHDMMLERLVQLAGPETDVLLVSGHGFQSGQSRAGGPLGAGTGGRGTAEEDWHRPQGIFCAAGPGLKKDVLIHGASVLDVTPTVLHLFGLPVGADMEGRPLLEAFEDPRPSSRIASWEGVPGESGLHPPGAWEDVWEERAAIDRLAAMGYTEAPSREEIEAARHARLRQKFHLALVHYDAGRSAEAAALFEWLLREEPGESTFALFLADCRLATGAVEECRRLAQVVLEREGDRAAADLILGHLALHEGRNDLALDHLLRAERSGARWPNLQCLIGTAYLRLRRWADAGRAFGRATTGDEGSARAYLGLALAYVEQDHLEEAAEAALTAVCLDHHSAEAHQVLGVALARLGRPGRAVQAFEMSLTLRPDSVEARQWLRALRARGAREHPVEVGGNVDES